MPRKRARQGVDTAVLDYRYDSARKHIPPAGLAAQGRVRETPRLRFAYDPHFPPVLRSDPTGAADRLQAWLESARTRTLTAEEVQDLSAALRHYEPWLEWAGKRNLLLGLKSRSFTLLLPYSVARAGRISQAGLHSLSGGDTVWATLVLAIIASAFRGSGNLYTFYRARGLSCSNQEDALEKEQKPLLSRGECLGSCRRL